MMEISDQLLTLAEVGSAFAGFTAIAGVLARSSKDRLGSQVSFWLMIEFSFALILFSLMPFVFFNFGFAEPTIWLVCSLLMVVFFPLHVAFAGKYVLAAVERGELSKYGPRVIVPLFLTVFVIQVLNVFEIYFERSYAAYFLGLILFLMLAFVNFILLLVEIWKPAPEVDA
ncbi:MAG: hypothetical protein ACI82A_001561 [Candidatus Azotimanducaceae bacterium]|jgi:hypothetical protein